MTTATVGSLIRTQERGMGQDEGWFAINTTAANGTEQVVRAAPGVGFRLVVCKLRVKNVGSAAGSYKWSDGSSGTAGNIFAEGGLAAGDTTPQYDNINFGSEGKPIFLSENSSLRLLGATNFTLTGWAYGFTVPIDSIKG